MCVEGWERVGNGSLRLRDVKIKKNELSNFGLFFTVKNNGLRILGSSRACAGFGHQISDR